MAEDRIVRELSIQSYFYGLLGDTCENMGLQLEESTSAYLVQLLSVYSHIEKDARFLLPLFERLKLALETAERRERFALLRRMGDCTLFLSGFFNEYYEGRGLNNRYLQSMGERAYASAAELVSAYRGAFHAFDAQCFLTLAQRFEVLSELLDQMRENTSLSRSPSLTQLLQGWQQEAAASVEGAEALFWVPGAELRH